MSHFGTQLSSLVETQVTTTTKTCHRLSIEITEAQWKGLQQYIPWGLRKRVFSALIDGILEMMVITGGAKEVLAAILAGEIKANLVIKDLRTKGSEDGSAQHSKPIAEYVRPAVARTRNEDQGEPPQEASEDTDFVEYDEEDLCS